MKQLKFYAMASFFSIAGILISSAADLTLTASDANPNSSFSGGPIYRWPSGLAPTAGNNYFSGGSFLLRSPYPGGSYTFAGDSLTVGATNGSAPGRLLLKGTNAPSILTANFILNGGLIDLAPDNGNLTTTLAGTVNVTGINNFLSSSSANSLPRILDVIAPISGSSNLQVGLSANTTFGGSSVNANGLNGTVRLSAANPYSGTLSTVGVASIAGVNGKLELGNLNALQNATLSLNTIASATSPALSFLPSANTGTFNIGALASAANNPVFALSDTVDSPVAISVGGNNANTSYGGPIGGSGSLTKVGTGTLTLTGTSTYSGTTTINGGSLQLGNGGTNGALYPFGGALVNNANLTINRNNSVVQGTDFMGPITGTGSLTQAGSGTTVLNSANSYSGATTVNAGKLVISSAQTGTGAITVANGAKLGIILSGTSQLPPSTLTLGTSAATTLEYDGINSTTVAPVNAGTVTLGATVTVNINSGNFTPGNSYPLIHWTTSGPANASSFTLGASPGLMATFSVSGSTLFLNVSAVSDLWVGAVDGKWDTTTPNWTANATIFANGHSVLFDDTSVNPSVTVTAPVLPSNVLFNNASLAYTVTSSGDNNIGGGGGLTKNSAGSVTLAGGANTYTGVTAINGGILSVSALADGGLSSDIGAASSASSNLLLNSGTLQYTGADATISRGATIGVEGGTVDVISGVTLTDSAVIAGPGSLTKTGEGTLALSGVNTYGGLTIVSAGTLTLAGASTTTGGTLLSAGQLNINNGGSTSANSAVGTGPMTISANTIIDNTSGSDVTLLPNNPQVWNGNFTYAGSANSLNLGTGAVSLGAATRTVTVNTNTLTVGGVISGTGGLTKAGPGTLVLSGANTFSGTMNIAAGGILAIGNNQAVGTGLLQFDGGTGGSTIQSTDGTARTITNNMNFNGVGAVAIYGGTGNLTFTGALPDNNGSDKTLVVNNPVTEFTDSGWGGASGRIVSGTGKLIFSGNHTYTGPTTIDSGATLQLGNGGSTGGLSPSSTIVNNGTLIIARTNTVMPGIDFASLTGSGAVIVNSGALFIPHTYQDGGTFTVANGAKLGVSASSVSNSATIGTLTLGSGGATTLDFSYTFAGNPTNAALQVGSVTISGSSAVRIGGNFAVGTFPVLKYSSLSGSFAASVAGPSGVTATLSNDVPNQTLYVTVSAVGGVIVWSKSGTTLSLTWPQTHLGWFAQSNSVNIADNNQWFNIAGSETVTNLNIVINPAQPKVFYRLRNP